jgi:acyl carrier protein
MMTIDDHLRRVLADVLDVSFGLITDDASPATIERWDSLRHMSLIVALEEEFGITLDDRALDETMSFIGARSAVMRLLNRAAA